ncbi:hypothetical protein R1flu_001100 [Riccia fluitans]|uniref:Uncharacterized protein n=1 Tax=Riccia fluitans TaxID=41844 RepID=A0ABD1Y2C3_9MARC
MIQGMRVQDASTLPNKLNEANSPDDRLVIMQPMVQPVMGEYLWQPESQRFTTFTKPARLQLQGLGHMGQEGLTGQVGTNQPSFGLLSAGASGSRQAYPMRIVGSPEPGLHRTDPVSVDAPLGGPSLHPTPPLSVQQPGPESEAEKETKTGNKTVTFASPSSRQTANSQQGVSRTANIFEALNASDQKQDKNGHLSTSSAENRNLPAQEDNNSQDSDTEETSSSEMSEDNLSESEKEDQGDEGLNAMAVTGTEHQDPVGNRNQIQVPDTEEDGMEESEGELPANDPGTEEANPFGPILPAPEAHVTGEAHPATEKATVGSKIVNNVLFSLEV